MSYSSEHKTVIDALAAKARGEDYDQDAFEEACSALVAAELVRGGVSMDTVEELFHDREHTFTITYDPATDDLTIDVVWVMSDPDFKDMSIAELIERSSAGNPRGKRLRAPADPRDIRRIMKRCGYWRPWWKRLLRRLSHWSRPG